MSIAIKLTLPDSLARELQEHARTLGYTNIQEITLEALREKTRKLQVIKRLYENKSTLDISEMTKKQRKELAESFDIQDESEVFRKFNLD